MSASEDYIDRVNNVLGDDSFYDDEANAKVIFGTLRSGQRVETPFSLIIMGDVNPGADIIAGGDIIILGSLRGTAHAAAYDDEGDDKVIFALKMQPMQLRIGTVISRGSSEGGKVPEIARIENKRIVVESFTSRSGLGRKK
jgi:septum site-determining protein MinC